MGVITKLTCTSCAAAYRQEEVSLTCPACGPARGILDVEYDLAATRQGLTWGALAARPRSHWRYHELLPVEEVPDWPVGWTPIWPAARLAAALGVARLGLKDDGRNPTASFKDRASSVAVVRARAEGAETIACASTGNAASSLAGYAAVAGLRAVIFVPATAPEPKLAQLLIYGATVFRVQGSYAQAYELCMRACAAFGWYNRCCAVNPYLVEGKKTAGLEIAEQCREEPPDWVAVSVGDGCTIAGVGKGLRQMRELGLIDWRARLLGVQAAGAAPIARAWREEEHQQRAAGRAPLRVAAKQSGARREKEWPGTMADSINVPVPANPAKALAAVRESGGTFVEVSDEAILEAMRLTGRLAGVFAEPAAAAAVAGVRAAVEQGMIGKGQSVVAMITGSGLKDTRAAMRAAGTPIEVPPDLDAVKRAWERAK